MRYVGQWLKAWVAALKDRRECARIRLPLVAYYWNGAIAQACEVKEISPAGAYIVTEDRWYPGTVLRLTFQYTNGHMNKLPSMLDDSEMTRMVRAKLVRIGSDGIGVRLIYLDTIERRRFKTFLKMARHRGFLVNTHTA